jgi:hypothetical protein
VADAARLELALPHQALRLGVCAAEENETDAKNLDLSDRVGIHDLAPRKGEGTLENTGNSCDIVLPRRRPACGRRR